MTTRAAAPAETEWDLVARDLGRQFRPTFAERTQQGQPPHEEMQAVRDSGLVNLRIPREFGGEGLGWPEAARAISDLAAWDPSVGALLAYHFTNFIPDLLDYETDGEAVQRQSAEARWLWSNVTQPWVPFRADPSPDGGFILNGVKPYNTATRVADVNTVLAPRTDRREFVYVYLPRDRDGITYHDDWDHFGLRRTDTITMTFDNVVVRPEEVLRDTHPGPRDTFPPLYIPQGSLAFAAILVGIARGALATALEIAEEFGSPLGDAELAARAGVLWAGVESLVALRETVAREVEAAYRRRKELTVDEIVALTQETEALRDVAAHTAIATASDVFELTGPRGADVRFGLDTYWRDVRIHSLHINPLIYTERLLGDVHLNGSPVTGPPFFLD